MPSRRMSSKGLRELECAVKKQFGCGLPEGLAFYVKEEKKRLKVFAYSGSSEPRLPFAWIGVHFGFLDDGVFAPSIEGAQLLGEGAVKNVVEVGVECARKYFRGEDITLPAEAEGIVLLKTEGKIIAPAQAKDNKLKNILPKSRHSK